MTVDKSLLISKPNCGKQIYFAPSEAENAALLKRAAREGYYYAVLALKQLESLASGPCGKHNVYIPNYNDVKAHSFQMFHIYLPGIRATVERRSNDRYVVSKLELSDGYKAIGSDDDKPGIYSITQSSDGAQTKILSNYRKNGQITAKDGRIVVIADMNHGGVENAARTGKKCIEEALGSLGEHAREFDLFYSPARTRIGFRQFDPRSIANGYTFSSLLARAMDHAQNKKDVVWLAERGGSAIFTQAMEIAERNNVSFKGMNHLAHLYKPATSPVRAAKLAHALNFKMGKNFVTLGGFQPVVAAQSLIANRLRVQNPNDSYSLKDYGKDIAKGALDGVAVGGVAALGASLALPGVPAIGTVGTTLSCIGAIHLLYKKAKNRN